MTSFPLETVALERTNIRTEQPLMRFQRGSKFPPYSIAKTTGQKLEPANKEKRKNTSQRPSLPTHRNPLKKTSHTYPPGMLGEGGKGEPFRKTTGAEN